MQESIIFKIKFGDEIRRFNYPAGTSWDNFMDKLSIIFNIEKGNYIVKYEDDDKEMITIDSTAELQEAIRVGNENITSSRCIHLELSKAMSPATAPRSVFELPRENEGQHYQRNNYRHPQWNRNHHRGQRVHPAHRYNHRASPCTIPGDELAQKLKLLEEKGFKCKMRNIRLLKMNDGDVDQVCEILLQKKNSGKYADKLQTLHEHGCDNHGINIKLLKIFDGNTEKVIEILAKSKKLEESGHPHPWLNVRLLIKYEGDMEKVEKVWQEKQDQLLQRAEKKRHKVMKKDQHKHFKSEKNAWHKAGKRRH